MKTFKEFLNDKESEHYEWCTIEADSEVIHILFNNRESGSLNEAKSKGLPVGGAYSLQFHKAHSPVGMDHLHGYERNNQLFALNIDGSAHDQSHRIRLPHKLAKAIRQQFPDFKLPKDNVIEWAPKAVQVIAKQVLLLG